MIPAKRPILDQELNALQDNILRMGSLVESMTEKAVRALKERKIDLAREVRADEKLVDQLRLDIEEAGIQCIATQQPLASDLRKIIAATHMAVELERMADYANGIAKIVIRSIDEPLLKPLIDIPRMQVIVCNMTHRALDAYVKSDVELARDVQTQDEEVDELYKQILRELVSYMSEDARTISRAMNLLFVAHNLERLGDRATNLCERVIYAVTGNLKEDKPKKSRVATLG
ncbi:MAG: phosphate signaling complex protein PhoU [Anaerolineae bacterium]|nr:phosphate signaling complex protein PhoU [Anaerolineae bacterium]